MANSCSTDHNCKFNNNIVLMFQEINVVKSAPFALLTIYQKSLYPPKIFKMPPFRQIMRNSPTIFSIWTTRNGNLKLHSKLREIRLIRQSDGERREIYMIIANLSQSLLLRCTPTFTANIAKFAQFADTWCESREINQLRTNCNKSSIFLLFFRHS